MGLIWRQYLSVIASCCIQKSSVSSPGSSWPELSCNPAQHTGHVWALVCLDGRHQMPSLDLVSSFALFLCHPLWCECWKKVMKDLLIECSLQDNTDTHTYTCTYKHTQHTHIHIFIQTFHLFATCGKQIVVVVVVVVVVYYSRWNMEKIEWLEALEKEEKVDVRGE